MKYKLFSKRSQKKKEKNSLSRECTQIHANEGKEVTVIRVNSRAFAAKQGFNLAGTLG